MKITINNNVIRRALIIQNPGNHTDFRTGVLADVRNFFRYLQSNIGGAWKEGEITVAPIDCTTDWIKDYFRSTSENTDYYLILFTGHGCYSKQRGPVCTLVNGQWFTHAWLNQQVSAVPTLFLTDSCQGIECLNEGVTLRQRIFSSVADISRRNLYRKEYDEQLRRLPSGMFVVGSSVSKGQLADENPKKGGFYILSLLEVARKLNQDSSAEKGVYGIGYLHYLAEKKVEKLSKGKQTPYLEGYTRSSQPPFMVKL